MVSACNPNKHLAKLLDLCIRRDYRKLQHVSFNENMLGSGTSHSFGNFFPAFSHNNKGIYFQFFSNIFNHQNASWDWN